MMNDAGRTVSGESGEELNEPVGTGEDTDTTPEMRRAAVVEGSTGSITDRGEAEPDKGMGAYQPILTGEEVVGVPGLPQAELPIPPAESTRGAPLFSEAAYQLPGPEAGLPEVKDKYISHDLQSAAEMLSLLLPDNQVQDLWQRVNLARQDIKDKINNLQIARTLLDQIQYTRNEILAGKDHFEEAERALNEVEYRIHLSQRVVKQSYTYGAWLGVYEVLWAVLAFAGTFILGPWLSALISANAVGATALNGPYAEWAGDIGFIINSMLYGAIGGAVGAMYSLIQHTARDQDFDKQYSMWYILNPVRGFVIGIFVYLVMRLGVFSMTWGEGVQVSSGLVMYTLSFLCGYQPNVVYDLIRRLLSVFRVEEGTN